MSRCKLFRLSSFQGYRLSWMSHAEACCERWWSRRLHRPSDLPPGTAITAWREPVNDLQKRNLGIAYVDVGMQRHSSPFVIEGFRMLTGIQQQFREDPDFFKWIGEALLLGKRTADAKFAFERALQLEPNSALNEAGAAAPYIQEGDAATAIPYLERAIALDPLNLPVASTLIGLYEKEGKITQATALSDKLKIEMTADTAASNTSPDTFFATSAKTADQAYKNIQVLKGIPSLQLIPSMQFMSSSLGVECSFCHVEGHFEKDDKEPKQIARAMLKMMFALNKDNFKDQREVTCYSCHRGLTHPVAIPDVGGESASRAAPGNAGSQETLSSLPAALDIIDTYIRALGGVAAIEAVTSRIERGTANVHGQAASVDIFTKTPDKRLVSQHFVEGDRVEAFDGNAGWTAISAGPARDLLAADNTAARMDADLQFPLHIQQMFPELHVDYPDKINDREANVLFGLAAGHPAVKFYFDKQSGLLVRLVRYTQSPLGLDPTEIDYSDYREVDGVQIPFRTSISRPSSKQTTQLREVRQNVPIDNAKFVKPRSDSASPK
jgi:photosynthetic reaction center cytochrome c subunit